MARGRKRALDAKRRATTRVGQGRGQGLPPIETMMRRLEAVGVAVAPELSSDPNRLAEHRRVVNDLALKHGIRFVSADHPIDMLHATGRLKDPRPPGFGGMRPEDQASIEEVRREISAARHAAASRFAWLHWHRYGRPFAAAIDPGYASAPPMPSQRPEEWDELSDEERDAWFAMALRWQESALARCGRHVQAVVVAVVAHCAWPRPAQMRALRQGLGALAEVRLPRVDDVRVPVTVS
jgi:hypothetical protein